MISLIYTAKAITNRSTPKRAIFLEWLISTEAGEQKDIKMKEKI